MSSEAFSRGYEWGRSHGASAWGGWSGSEYASGVDKEIEALLESMDRRGIRTNAAQYQGNMQEFGIASRFNVLAKARGSDYRAEVLESTEFASVDVRIFKVDRFGREVQGTGINYSLKSYRDAAKSGRVQATTLGKTYRDHLRKKGLTEDGYSFERFCVDRKIDPSTARRSDLMYGGDILLVAKGKRTGACKAIRRQMRCTSDPEQLASLQEALDMLDDRIESPDGEFSVFMWTRTDAERFTRSAKKGKLDLDRMGLSMDDIFTERALLKAAWRSGRAAFLVTMACGLAPMIASSVDDLMHQGYIDMDVFSGEVLEESAEAFLQGAVTSYLATRGAVEMMRRGLQDVITPDMIGLLVVLTVDVIATTIRGWLRGSGGAEVAAKCLESTAVALSAYAGMKLATLAAMKAGATIAGTATVELGPFAVVAALIGSLAGAVVGSIATGRVKDSCISLCMENGYTFFGLVDQDYTLPPEVRKVLPLDGLDLDAVGFDPIASDRIPSDRVRADEAGRDSILDVLLTRGLLDGSHIGYMVAYRA